MNGEWTLLDESGGTAVSFTSLVSMDYSNEGQALTYPVELGSFVDYNKTQSPTKINVTLGVQGTDIDFAQTLGKLDEYKKEAIKLSVVTPSNLYESFTLESYSYRRETENGAGMLMVDLSLIEVREVGTQAMTSTITRPRNPTSALNVNTGKTQAEAIIGSVLDAGRTLYGLAQGLR